MVETNIEINVAEEFPAGINVVKEGDNNVSKEGSPSVWGKDSYKYDEGIDEVTGNKEIEQANTEIVVY